MTAVETFPLQDDLVSFFGTYYMSTGAATLIMHFFVTGFILTRFGILAGLLVLPISLAIGSSGFLAIGTLSAVFIAKFSDQVFKFSTNNAVQEILWLPVAPEKKKRVKRGARGIPLVHASRAGICKYIAVISINTQKLKLLFFVSKNWSRVIFSYFPGFAKKYPPVIYFYEIFHYFFAKWKSA